MIGTLLRSINGKNQYINDMKSTKKFIVEMESRAVYSSKSFENARRVTWIIIHRNKDCEVIVQLNDIICGL